jgi:Response regulator containing CheY-like receiver, AAA-type ATPase, and DNA-binding domains
MTRLYSTHNKIRKAKEQFEIMFINDALEENEYDLRKTAEDLNIHYSNLHRRMRSLGMSTCLKKLNSEKIECSF